MSLTHFQRCVSAEGPRGAPERGHPGRLRLRSAEASGGQAAHNAALLALQLAAGPRTACLSARQGPVRLRSVWAGERCQRWLLIKLAHYLCPNRGPRPLGESSANICVCVMSLKWSAECKFLLPPVRLTGCKELQRGAM